MAKPLVLLVTHRSLAESGLAVKLAEDCMVTLAHSKEQVLQEMQFRSVPFTAFIIDTTEFGQDAIETIEVILNNYQGEVQPVIAIVVDDVSDPIVKDALRVGADDVVVKPYSVYAHRRILNYIRLHEVAQGFREKSVDLLSAQEKMEHLLTRLPGGIFRYRAVFEPGKDLFDYVSPGLVAMAGCADEEEFRTFTGNTFLGFVHPDDRERLLINFQSDLPHSSSDKSNYRIIRKDGEVRWLEDWGNMVTDAAGDRWVYVVVLDITEKILERESLIDKSEHDGLTGIFNRKAAIKRITDLRSESNAPCAFMIMDIDNFKGINDTYGHPFGDEVLKHLARFLDGTVRGNDVVARLGGDEFSVFLMGLGEGDRLTKIVEGIQSNAFADFDSSQFGVEGVTPSISIGVTTAPNADIPFDGLYAMGDEALYKAKTQGKNRASFNHA